MAPLLSSIGHRQVGHHDIGPGALVDDPAVFPQLSVTSTLSLFWYHRRSRPGATSSPPVKGQRLAPRARSRTRSCPPRRRSLCHRLAQAQPAVALTTLSVVFVKVVIVGLQQYRFVSYHIAWHASRPDALIQIIQTFNFCIKHRPTPLTRADRPHPLFLQARRPWDIPMATCRHLRQLYHRRSLPVLNADVRTPKPSPGSLLLRPARGALPGAVRRSAVRSAGRAPLLPQLAHSPLTVSCVNAQMVGDVEAAHRQPQAVAASSRRAPQELEEEARDAFDGAHAAEEEQARPGGAQFFSRSADSQRWMVGERLASSSSFGGSNSAASRR